MVYEKIHSEIREVVFKAIGESHPMKIDDISICETRMEDMGLGDNEILKVKIALQESFGVRFKSGEITPSATVKNIADYILFKRNTAEERDEKIREIKARIFKECESEVLEDGMVKL